MIDPVLGDDFRPARIDAGGKSRDVFLYKGEICPIIRIKNQAGIKAGRYNSIKKDFEYVIMALELARKIGDPGFESVYEYGGDRGLAYTDHQNEKAAMLQSLYISSIVTYGKAFVQAQGRGIKLEARDVFPHKGFLKIHSKIMAARHEYIAHAGNGDYERTDSIIFLNPDLSSGIMKGPVANSLYLRCPSPEELSEYLSISRHILNHCIDRAQKQLDLIHLEYSAMSADELYRRMEK